MAGNWTGPAFLAVVLAQAAHSIEEYFTRMYDFGPARFVSGLFSADRQIGFAIANALLVGLGLWCYFGPVRHLRRSAHSLAWFWAILELINGAGHMTWALSAGGYRPGLVTAPVLAASALTLAWTLRRGREWPSCP